MQLTITDTNNLTALDLKIVGLLLAGAQPEVACNTGTTGEGAPSLRLPDCGVSEGAGETAATVQDPAPAPDKKERKARTKKEELAVSAAENPTAAPVDGASESSQAEAGSPSTEEQQAPIASDASDTKTYTDEDVGNALRGFVTKHGMDAAMVLLKKFNAIRKSEIKPDDYAAFVKACNE